MRVKHYYGFDIRIANKMCSKKLNANNWDILRTDEKPGAFTIERDVNSYEENCMIQGNYEKYAEKILEIIKHNNFGKITSLGVGKGILEWHLKRLNPMLNIQCVDYTHKGLEMLKDVFVDCDEFLQFDMLEGNYSLFADRDVIIMYRLSTEFSIKQWKKIINKMYEARIKYVIFVPTEILTLKIALFENIRFFINIFTHKKNIFCGWLYSKREFMSFFIKKKKKMYIITEKIKYDNNMVFCLRRNENN